MTRAISMLHAHPRPAARAAELLAACIAASVECAQACVACADGCLADVALVDCARRALDCADVCDATARILTRRRDEVDALARKQLEACVAACAPCADQCDRHPDDTARRECAVACRACEQSCLRLLREPAPAPSSYGLDGV